MAGAGKVSCRCAECGASYKVPLELSGKKIKCRGCGSAVPVAASGATASSGSKRVSAAVEPASADPIAPRHRTAASPRGAPRRDRRRKLLTELTESFAGDFPKPRVSLSHRLVALVVLCFMLLLPVVYLSIAAGVGWLTWWHATHNTFWFTSLRGRAAGYAFIIYGAFVAAGILWFLSMLRPLFLRLASDAPEGGLSRSKEPVLFAFTDRLADIIGSPRPEIIFLSTEVNASASYQPKWFGLARGKFTLTLGVPLVAGLTLTQLAGVIAHEFGHFSQKGSTFLQRTIMRVNMWFAAAVHERGILDELIESASGSENGIGMLFGFVCWAVVGVGRMILWVLMHVGFAVSSALLRQMEFDADQYETGIAGSDEFARTSRRIIELTVANAVTREYILASQNAQHLPEDYPHFVAGLADHYIPVRKKAKSYLKKEKSSWFASHPVTRQRIDRAASLELPGIFSSRRAGGELLSDFKTECRDLTRFLYTMAFGEEVRPETLRKTDEALRIYLETMGQTSRP